MKLKTVFCLHLDASAKNKDESIRYSEKNYFDKYPTIEQIEGKVREYLDRFKDIAEKENHDIYVTVTQSHKVVH